MKLKYLAAAALLSAAAASPAFAVIVPLDQVSGLVEWKISGLTTEYINGDNTALPPPPVTNTHFGSNESTWGVGTVNGIAKLGSNIWDAGTNGQYLNYFLYGIHDLSTSSGGANGTNIYNDGATGGSGDGKIHLDIYLANSQFDSSTATLANRTTYNTYNGLTNVGSLYLSLEFVPHGIADDLGTAPNEFNLATLFQNATAATLPASGTGFFYANIVGGSLAAQAQWNTNSFLGGEADFNGAFTLTTSTSKGFPNAAEFPGFVSDPIASLSVIAPEPASLALLGLGLAGLALRRRKVA